MPVGLVVIGEEFALPYVLEEVDVGEIAFEVVVVAEDEAAGAVVVVGVGFFGNIVVEVVVV